MTENAHWQYKVKRLKASLAVALVFGFSAALWLAIGWMCWTIIKSPP